MGVFILSRAMTSVVEEREKQKKKWSDEHDDDHSDGSLANAAAMLATSFNPDQLGTLSEEGPIWGQALEKE